MRIMETIKKSIRSWLEIQPADPYNIKIIDSIDFETNAIRNKSGIVATVMNLNSYTDN